MALPTGTISLSQVNVELDRNATATINLNDADVRSLAERVTGVISMSDLQGKSALFSFTITSNVTNANLRTLAINAGWDENTEVEITVDSGVVISGNTQANSTAAMTIDGTWPQGITLVNNGVIQGRGGNGGPRRSAGAAGGRALLVSTPVSIENNGAIRGGGGGGGGGGDGGRSQPPQLVLGAGGGGGRSSLTNSSGGSGGPAGTGGTINGAGTGGARNGGGFIGGFGGFGGNGGNFGAGGGGGEPGAGGNTFNPTYVATSFVGGGGGGAGQAVSGNPNITWLTTGTRTGPIV